VVRCEEFYCRRCRTPKTTWGECAGGARTRRPSQLAVLVCPPLPYLSPAHGGRETKPCARASSESELYDTLHYPYTGSPSLPTLSAASRA
jgi:hypothetical protein